MDDKELVAGRLKEVRKSLNMNQEELALKLGIKRNTLSQYEGAKASMSMEVFLRFIHETGCSADWILTGEQATPQYSNSHRQKVEILVEKLNDEALHDIAILIEAYLINHPKAKK